MSDRTLSNESPPAARIKSLALCHAVASFVVFILAFWIPMGADIIQMARSGTSESVRIGILFFILVVIILPALAAMSSATVFAIGLIIRRRSHPFRSRFALPAALISGAIAFPGFYSGFKLAGVFPRTPSAVILLACGAISLAAVLAATSLSLQKTPGDVPGTG